MAHTGNANVLVTDTVELKTKDLPKSQYNCAGVRRPSLQRDWTEKCLLKGKDRRKTRFIKTNDKGNKNVFNLIGQLEMKINGGFFVGTACIIAFEYCSGSTPWLYALTAAHNVCDADPITQEKIMCSECWFNRRDTFEAAWWWNEYSKINKSYPVQKLWVHPSYDPLRPTASPYDIAIVAFRIPGDYNTDYYCQYDTIFACKKNVVAIHGGLPGCDDIVDYDAAYLYGYPGEKNGCLYGMKGKKMEEEKGLLTYDDIDTTAGQSGSPIFIHQTSAAMLEVDYIPLVCIGVHTGGSITAGKNWAVYLDKSKREWIKQILEKNASKTIFPMIIFEPQKNQKPLFMLENQIV